jgi:tRNA(Arg) A34 adenosine deaminase TadA
MSATPHPEFMREAIRQAIAGVAGDLGGPFGAVVVQQGQIVGRGCNCVTSTNDPTAHAEVMAIRNACRQLGVFHLTGCELYTSCEPCPMCLAAIYWAHIDRYFFGCTAEEAAAAGFADDFIHREFALPPDQRSIPAVRLLPAESAATFRAWQAKSDRIAY